MADVLIHYDEQAYLSKLGQVEAIGESILQPLVTQFNALGVGDLEPSELKKLFTGPVELIFDKMTNGQPVNIAGIEVVKAKAIEILKKPNGYDDLLKKVSEVKEQLKDNQYEIPVSAPQIDFWFEIDVDGIVSVTAAQDQRLQNEFKRYASSDAAKSMYAFAQSIVAYYNANDIKNAKGGISIEEALRKMVTISSTGAAIVNIDGVLWFNNSYYKTPAQ